MTIPKFRTVTGVSLPAAPFERPKLVKTKDHEPVLTEQNTGLIATLLWFDDQWKTHEGLAQQRGASAITVRHDAWRLVKLRLLHQQGIPKRRQYYKLTSKGTQEKARWTSKNP
jgi:hypothetical protein